MKGKAAASAVLECEEQLAVTPVPLEFYPGGEATAVPLSRGNAFNILGLGGCNRMSVD